MTHQDRKSEMSCVKRQRLLSIPGSGTSDETYIPKSLFRICIHFIARHVSNVDSLVGFPEVVGKQLFKEVEDCGKLESLDSGAVHVLELFSVAYGGAVLSSLCLSSCHLIIHEVVGFSFLLDHLEELDLTSCKIGDENELLSDFQRFKQLKLLNLTDNALSDDGLQKLTLSVRIFKYELNELLHLNLSCNPCITCKSMKYLTCFKGLKLLELSGTTVKREGIKVLESRSNLRLSKERVKQFDVTNKVCNVGWGADVLHKWTSKTTAKSKLSNRAADAPTKSFYGKTIEKMAKLSRYTVNLSCPVAEPRLQLVANSSKSESTVLNERSVHKNTSKPDNKCVVDLRHNKQKREDRKDGENKQLTFDEQELMNSYMSTITGNKATGSLWDAMQSSSW